jgi:hypothetical protein
VAQGLLDSRQAWALLAAEFGPELPALASDLLTSLRRRRSVFDPRARPERRPRAAGGAALALVAAGLVLVLGWPGSGDGVALVAGGLIGAGVAWLAVGR